VKPKPAQESWYRVAICLHEFGQRLVAPRLQILKILRVIGAEPHHHGKVADLGGASLAQITDNIYPFKKVYIKWYISVAQILHKIPFISIKMAI